MILVLGGLVLSPILSSAANLVAHWSMDQSGAPYTDASPNGINLNQDTDTTTAMSAGGIAGSAAQLNWQPTPGVSTRLFGNGTALQVNSFGFSFWLNPVFLNPFDNLIGKEMAFNNSVPGWARMAWQLQVGGETAGFAPLEFVIRGDNRANGDFYGNVFSAGNVALRSDTPDWIHVAGGYDSLTGALMLYLNGASATSGNSSPGAHSSDGSPFDIGTGRNGADLVTFAAGALIDDVQLYDGILSEYDVAYLRANPGLAIVPEPSSFALLGMGLLFAMRLRRSRQS